jgi:WD40 repeat protein
LSPDEKMILTGTSVRKGFGHGMLVCFDANTGEDISKTPICQDSIVTVFWHPVLNQIIVGSADSNIRVLYDPEKSNRGITTSLTKLEKRRPIDQNMVFNKPILLPSIYEDEREKEMEKDPYNPNNQMIPSCVIPAEVLNP